MGKEGINVLSLFDGMACTRMALDVLGVKVNKYFASEVDKYSIQMSKHLYPDIIHLGDVQFVTASTFGEHRIDLIVGGSPCQGFSNAGKGLNFDDPRSALFFEYVRLVRELRPRYFLLENVKMKGEWRDIISEYMGVEPIFINSALVSAQNRQRYYWTNIEGVEQPEDRGIVLRDILESGIVDSEKSFCIDGNYFKGGNPKQYFEKSRRQLVFEQHGNKLRVPEATKLGYAEAGEGEGLDLSFPKSKTRRGRLMKDKSNCVTSAGQDMGVVVSVREVRSEDAKSLRRESRKNGRDYNPFRSKNIEARPDDKVACLQTSLTNEHKVIQVAGIDENGNTCYVDREKSRSIIGSIGRTTEREYFKKNQGQMLLQDDGVRLKWRKLTVRECARLQTVPEHLIDRMMESGVSNSQMYKQLGNGFTVDVIAHILSYAKWS